MSGAGTHREHGSRSGYGAWDGIWVATRFAGSGAGERRIWVTRREFGASHPSRSPCFRQLGAREKFRSAPSLGVGVPPVAAKGNCGSSSNDDSGVKQMKLNASEGVPTFGRDPTLSRRLHSPQSRWTDDRPTSRLAKGQQFIEECKNCDIYLSMSRRHPIDEWCAYRRRRARKGSALDALGRIVFLAPTTARRTARPIGSPAAGRATATGPTSPPLLPRSSSCRFFVGPCESSVFVRTAPTASPLPVSSPHPGLQRP